MNNKIPTYHKRNKPITFIYYFGIVFVILYTIIGFSIYKFDYDDTLPSNARKLDTEWVMVREDGSSEIVELPDEFDVAPGEKIILKAQLPDNIEDNFYICFEDYKQECTVLIGKELRCEYSTRDNRVWGKASTNRFLFVPLSPADSGKVISIEMVTDTKYAGKYAECYIGDSLSLWKILLHEFGPEMLLGVIVLVVFVMLFIITIIISVEYDAAIDLIHLAVLGILASVWVLCQGRARQLFIPNSAIANDISFFMIILLPYPLLLYVDSIQRYRFHSVYTFIEGLVAVNLSVQILLQVLGVLDFLDMFIMSVVVFMLAIVVVYIFIIKDLIVDKNHDYICIGLGILIAGVLTVIQFALYLARVVSFNGISIIIAMIVMAGAAFVDTFRGLKQSEKEKAEVLAQTKAESTFLAHMSHEIRTPINAILGMDEILIRETKDDELKEYARDIQTAGHTLLAIVNDILDESKIRAGKMEIVPVKFNLESVLHELESMFSVKAWEKGLDFRMEIEKELPDTYLGDDVRIRQVMNNLLSNAIKYTNEGGVTLSVSGTCEDNMARLKFSVADTGIGIKPEDMKTLFNSFARLDMVKNRNIEGTGLGLSIAYRILEMMGSELKVSSVYGEGSVFTFSLILPIIDKKPLVQAIMDAHAAAEESKDIIRQIAPGCRILLADDNPLNIKVFCKLVDRLKLDITTAVNGLEAVEKSGKEKYDVIFMDHMMPIMDGVEALEHIRADDSNPNRNTPVVMLTANVIGDARNRYLGIGFDDFISKPFAPQTLETIIFKYVPQEKIVYLEPEAEDKKEDLNSYPNIEGIDWKETEKNLPERELIDIICTEFAKSAHGDIEQLENFFDMLHSRGNDKDFDSYRILVHALKNSAATIGAMEISKQAKTLEFAARNSDIEEIDRNHHAFCTSYMKLADDIAYSWGIDNQHNMAVPSDADIEGELDKLEQAMKLMDIETLNNIMEELEKHRFTAEIQKEISRISEAVLSLNEAEFYAGLQNIRRSLL